MELKEFLHKSPKLNEIPKPGVKSHLKMAPQVRETYYENSNMLRFAATIMLFYPVNKKYIFVL